MALIKYDNILGGLNWDVPYHSIGDNEWIEIVNGRIFRRCLEKVTGSATEFNNLDLQYTETPRLCQLWESIDSGGVTNAVYVYAVAGKINNVGTGGIRDIRQGGIDYTNVLSPTPAAVPVGAPWTFAAFSGGYNMVASNPYIIPQYMNGDQQTLSDLPGWVNSSVVPNTAASTCAIIRPFKSQLIAGNLAFRSTSNLLTLRPSTILISDVSAPGGVPQSWTSLANNSADSIDLQTTEPILDIVILRDVALVLTKTSAFLVGESNSQTATKVSNLSYIRGVISKECAVVVDGVCYIVTQNDIMATDGSTTGWQSISNDTIKSNFFERDLQVNGGQYSFLRYNAVYDELSLYYPQRGSGTTACTQCLIYNLGKKAWSTRETPPIYDATQGPTTGGADLTRPWPINTYNFDYYRPHFIPTPASGSTARMYALDVGSSNNVNGILSPYQFRATKFIDFKNIQGAGADVIKYVSSVYPILQGAGIANIKMKFFNSPVYGTIDWTTPDADMTFDMSGAGNYPNYKVDPNLRCRYMAIQISSFNTSELSLSQIYFDVGSTGKPGAG